MRLTVLGCSPSRPNPGDACSGYLLESGGVRLLADCGSGVVSRLQRQADYSSLAGILISHFHADHWLDLVPYRYGLKYAPRQGRLTRPRLYLPPDGRDYLTGFLAGLGEAASFFEDVFTVEEYDPAASLTLGSIEVRFQSMPHHVPCYGMRFSDGERELAYSADTGPGPALVELARDADLLLCEATLSAPTDEPAGRRGHLSPDEAGALAREAGARRLLLTHFWAEVEREELRRHANAAFGRRVELARGGRTYQV